MPIGLLINDLMLFTSVFALLAERGRPEEGFITAVASEEIINLLDLGNIAAKSQAKCRSIMVQPLRARLGIAIAKINFTQFRALLFARLIIRTKI